VSGTFALHYLLSEPALDSVTKIKRTRLAFYLLAIAAVVFRAELGLLIAAHCLYLLAKAITNDARWTLFTRTIVPAGLSGALVGLALTVTIDTFFWQADEPIWPELIAFLSNVFPTHNSPGASAWGTSPWHWYFTSALPRLLLCPVGLPLLVYSTAVAIIRPSSTPLLAPSLIYTAIYSILPHKETRFLFPILPSLTTCVALAAQHLTTNRALRNFIKPLLILIALTTALLSHAVLLPLSSLNYPGAFALHSLHRLAHNTKPHIRVHLDNLSLQTGITRFLQLPPPSSPLVQLPGRLAPGGPYRPEYVSGDSMWVYDKTENATELLTPMFWEGFDWCIMEEPGKAIGAWDVKDVVYGLGKPVVIRPGHKAVFEKIGTWTGLLDAMYGEGAGRAYERLKDVVYKKGLTRGWWIEWGLQAKLYVLKKGYAVRGGVPRATL
jgi:alpha-1,6-mannosyltransferase